MKNIKKTDKQFTEKLFQEALATVEKAVKVSKSSNPEFSIREEMYKFVEDALLKANMSMYDIADHMGWETSSC